MGKRDNAGVVMKCAGSLRSTPLGVWIWSVCIGEHPGNARKLRGDGVKVSGEREGKGG